MTTKQLQIPSPAHGQATPTKAPSSATFTERRSLYSTRTLQFNSGGRLLIQESPGASWQMTPKISPPKAPPRPPSPDLTAAGGRRSVCNSSRSSSSGTRREKASPPLLHKTRSHPRSPSPRSYASLLDEASCLLPSGLPQLVLPTVCVISYLHPTTSRDPNESWQRPLSPTIFLQIPSPSSIAVTVRLPNLLPPFPPEKKGSKGIEQRKRHIPSPMRTQTPLRPPSHPPSSIVTESKVASSGGEGASDSRSLRAISTLAFHPADLSLRGLSIGAYLSAGRV